MDAVVDALKCPIDPLLTLNRIGYIM